MAGFSLLRLGGGLFIRLFAGGFGLFVLERFAEFAQLLLGEFEGFGFIAEHAFGGLFDAFLQVIEFTLALVAEGLGGLPEIPLAQLVDELLLVRIFIHDLVERAQELIVAEGVFLLFKQRGGGLKGFVGLILMRLTECFV